MRFYKKSDDYRIETWFALFPVEIDNEVRWLETVSILQSKHDGPLVRMDGGWINLRFVDKYSNLSEAVAEHEAETIKRMKLKQ